MNITEKLKQAIKEYKKEYSSAPEAEAYYLGDQLEMDRDILELCQVFIGRKFVILTEDELKNREERYHNSMEGFRYDY